MKCFYCGKEIDDDAHFCPLCGHDLSNLIKCPNCGSLLERGTKFCTHCGSPIELSEKEGNKSPITKDESTPDTISPIDNEDEDSEENTINSDQPYSTNQENVVEDSGDKGSGNEGSNNDDTDTKVSHKGIKWILITILIILGCIGLGWFFLYYQHRPTFSTTNDSLDVQSINVDSSQIDDLQRQNTEYIKQRLEDIYVHALEDMSQNSDAAYLSSSFNAIYNEAEEKAAQDSTLLFDVNHWTMSQESNHPSMQIEKITINKETAIANIVINDYWDDGQTSQTKVRLILKFEHGDWYIDDFQAVKGSKVIFSERAEAENYLGNH